MNQEQIESIKLIFAGYPGIKLAYFFGSRVDNKTIGPLSDYDFAVYLKEKDAKIMFDIKLALMDKIGCLLKTNKVDVAVLNLTESPELKYNIIAQGRLIYEEEPYRVIVEPRILNEYFDFKIWIEKCDAMNA